MQDDLWLRRFHPRPEAPVRLVCLPHAGGSASYYYPLSEGLSDVADVLTVQYPGRQDRHGETPLDTVEAYAEAVRDALGPWSDRPLALFGHSMGASVAYEVALRLEEARVPVAALFVSGRRAPTRHRESGVHLLGDAGLVAAVSALSGTDPAVLRDRDLLRVVLPAIRADYRAAETYRGREGTAVSCPIHVHLGDGDSEVGLDEAWAWADHTTGPATVTVYSGGHFYLNEHVASIVESLAGELRSRPARVSRS